MFKIKLPFYEMDGEIGSASTETTSEASSVVTEGNIPSDTGNAPVLASETATEQPEVTQQESFAKRLNEKLTAERQKWEQEQQEKMRDYETRAQSLDRVARMYGYEDHEEFMQAVEQAERERAIKAEAAKLGVDESVIREHLTPMKQQIEQYQQKLTALEQKEQERQLQTQFEKFAADHPDYSEYWDGIAQLYQKGYDLYDAYKIASYDAKLQKTKLEAEQETLARVTGRDQKTVLPSKDQPNNVQFNPANMSFDQIDEISKRVQRGEKITFK